MYYIVEIISGKQASKQVFDADLDKQASRNLLACLLASLLYSIDSAYDTGGQGMIRVLELLVVPNNLSI